MSTHASEVSAAALFRESVKLYDELHRGGDKSLLEQIIGLYHVDAELTATVGGVGVRAPGRDAIRHSIEQSLAGETRQHHMELEALADEGGRAVFRYTLVHTQGGKPLVAFRVECAVRERDGYIGSLALREVDPSPGAIPYPPLGSTVSYSGEIIGYWEGERLLLRISDGRAVEVPVPEELEEKWSVGDPVLVFYEQGEVVGWYMPEQSLGVDLRASD